MLAHPACVHLPEPAPDPPDRVALALLQGGQYLSPSGTHLARTEIVDQELVARVGPLGEPPEVLWDSGATVNRWHGVRALGWATDDWLVVDSSDCGLRALQHTELGWADTEPRCALSPDQRYAACVRGERYEVRLGPQHPLSLEGGGALTGLAFQGGALDGPLPEALRALPALAVRWDGSQHFVVWTHDGETRVEVLAPQR